MRNLLADVPLGLAEEQFLPLLAGSAFRVEQIVSHGRASPEGFWYDQDEHEWVLLLQGRRALGIRRSRP
ncbi:MAG: hypothetical protein K2X38_16780 [Gemmataceae bacterium]|nr:hypothetical protein [Gemmataceae bacterium]